MNPSALAAYRRRIGDDGPLHPDEGTLRRLQRRHLLAVPFENLDVVAGRPVSTDPAAAFAKIVERGRGGWCFEQNGVFAEVLRALGFRVEPIGATVGEGERGVLNHLALLVHLEDTWLVDVGFGLGPLEPLPLREGVTRLAGGTFGLSRSGDLWALDTPGEGPGYAFTTRVRGREEFEPANQWLQTDPSSPFTRGPFVARALDDGYITLRTDEFRRLRDGATVEHRTLGEPAEFETLLNERFGLGAVLNESPGAFR